jgi:hypothetical protein
VSWCIDPRFLDLGTSWRWTVNFALRPLYPRGKSPRYPLKKRLDRPQSRCGQRGEKKILHPTGTRTRGQSWPVPAPLCFFKWSGGGGYDAVTPQPLRSFGKGRSRSWTQPKHWFSFLCEVAICTQRPRNAFTPGLCVTREKRGRKYHSSGCNCIVGGWVTHCN